MPVKPDLEQANFGLLPEPERSPGSFITSTVINGLIPVSYTHLDVYKRQIERGSQSASGRGKPS